MANNPIFFQNFERICKERGMSMSQVAVKCGLSTSAVTRWKTSRSPSERTISVLSEFLGVPKKVFFEDPNNHSITIPQQTKSFEEGLIDSFKAIPTDSKIRLLQIYADELLNGKN